MQRKESKEKHIQQNKQNKGGLGPSELALWATSPDPETLQTKKQQKKTKNK